MIKKIDIKNRVFQETAARSRFMDKKALNTFDASSDSISKLANNLTGAIASTASDITFTYDVNELKTSLSSLLKRKGRFGDYENIIFVDSHEETNQQIIIDKDEIFKECTIITAHKDEKNIMTVDDEILFNALYLSAIRDLSTTLKAFGNIDAYNDTINLTEAYSAATHSAIEGRIRNYMLYKILNLFYKIKGVDAFTTEMQENITSLARILNLHAESDGILKDILSQGAWILQDNLHPLNKRLATASLDYTTNIVFKILREDIELSGSTIYLIYNIGKSIILNSALKRWFELSSIDATAETTEVNQCVNSLKYLVEDRLRLDGLFDALYTEALNNIISVYQDYSEIASFTTANDETTLSLSRLNPGTTEIRDTAFWQRAYDNCRECIYEYIFNRWLGVSGQASDYTRYDKYIKQLSFDYIKLLGQS